MLFWKAGECPCVERRVLRYLADQERQEHEDASEGGVVIVVSSKGIRRTCGGKMISYLLREAPFDRPRDSMIR